MTDSNYTALLVIVDRSGSMSSIKSDAEGGLNTLIASQAEVEGHCTVKLVQFDDVYDVVWPSTDVRDQPRYTLVPRGSTALLDAMGRAITDFGKELAGMPESRRPGKVLVVVVTDGFENASREWSWTTVNKLVTEQKEKYAWEFTFIGANQDAVLTGHRLGIERDKSITFTASAAGTSNVYSSLANNVSMYRSAGSFAYDDSDRLAATEE